MSELDGYEVWIAPLFPAIWQGENAFPAPVDKIRRASVSWAVSLACFISYLTDHKEAERFHCQSSDQSISLRMQLAESLVCSETSALWVILSFSKNSE